MTIWESEGQPNGHEYRDWEMALKLAEMQKDISDESVAGNTLFAASIDGQAP